MEEVTYTISQAAKIVGVETYVLRFWEEELLLDIGRNAKGYRAYTKENIVLLKKIKELKKDYQLKDIRHMLLDKDQKIDRFLEIMDRVVSETLEVRKSPENRFRKIDMAIRSRQQARKMAAELENTRQSKAGATAENTRQSQAGATAENTRQSKAALTAENTKQSKAELTTENTRQSKAVSAAESTLQSKTIPAVENIQKQKLVAAAKGNRHKKLRKRSQTVKMDSYTIS